MSLRRVQKIACTSHVAFPMQFCVAHHTGRTRSTDDIPAGRTRIIDLASAGIADGAAVWPVVHAEGGGSYDGDIRVAFARNNEVATYLVGGSVVELQPCLVGHP
jgi:hypothetical protein